MTISVIIATYGEEHWSKLANDRALPSAEAQDPDDIVFLHSEDGTRASSLNEAARSLTSKGDWLIFLDADDELAPGYIAAMRQAVERHGADTPVLFTPACQRISRGRPSPPSFFDPGRATLREANWLVIGTLIRRDLFFKVGGFDEHPHGFEDFALWSKCYRIGATVVKVPDAVYRYYVNPQSKHRQGWRDKKWQLSTHRRVVAELDAWEKQHAAVLG